MIVIGIDPDSDYLGVAFYIDGILCDLKMMRLHSLLFEINRLMMEGEEIVISIEDTTKNNAIFGLEKALKEAKPKSFVHAARIGGEKGRRLGVCQQPCKIILDMCEDLDIEVHTFKISSAWKKRRGTEEGVQRCYWLD